MTALAACSALPELPFLGGGGRDVESMLDRIDPSVLDEAEGSHLTVSWSRPAAAAEALGLDDSADLRALGTPARRLNALTITDPRLLLVPPSTEDLDLDYLMSARRLITPSDAIAVASGTQEVVLWNDAAPMVEDLETAFDGYFTREGDALVLESDDTMPQAGRTALIAPIGDDLLWTSAATADGIDTGESAASLFNDLPGLLAAIDLEDAHLSRGAVAGEGSTDGDRAIEWLWATRLDAAEEHTTRGAIRVEGDAGAFAQRLLDGAPDTRGRMVVQEAEADGDLVRVTISREPPGEDADWDDIFRFYASMPEVVGPGVPVTG